MITRQTVTKTEMLLQRLVCLGLLAVATGLTVIQKAKAGTNLLVWDTGSRLTDVNGAENRAAWKRVPSELFVFEADPPKAASDPGYYGREYSFKGDTVVENRSMVAVFWSEKGRVVLYSKADADSSGVAASSGEGLGKKILEFVPFQSKASMGKLSRCEILRNAADEVIIQVFTTASGMEDSSVAFYFGRTEIIEIKPGAKTNGISLLSPIEYGVVPGFIGDDLIFSSAQFESAETPRLPSENVFLGLLKGEGSEFVMTWPKGRQQLSLRLAKDPQSKLAFESIDFNNDGKSLYLAALSAPGIWHREELKPAFLEKDVALTWKPPFAARWKTQLSEAGVQTTFAFRESRGQVWRGVPGSYNYPAWFEDGRAFVHLSKKVPPKGESLIYFLEGQDTPLDVPTPVDFVRATLGRELSESVLDPTGRKLRTHHRRGGEGVHRACTCGCTEAIQAVFEAGEEVTKKDYIAEALDDMKYFVGRHVERIGDYQRFASDVIQLLHARVVSEPELKSYLEDLEQIVQQIPQEYSVQKENMKSAEHVTELSRKTMSLTGNRSANNLTAYMDLLKAWRAMGGAQDYVLAQCHTITRKLFQEAGYGCVNEAKAVAVAQEIRSRCRQILRNPDGYEIWANY